MKRLFVFILAALVCLPAAAAAPGVLDELNRELVAAVAAADGAVVTVRAEEKAPGDKVAATGGGTWANAMGLLNRARLGTGFVFDEAGYILTTSNVVGSLKEVTVELPGGAKEKAEVRGTDPGLGIAVLKIARTGLKALPLGDSDAVKRGSLVVGIGNQEGLQGSAVLAMVSGVDRTISNQTGMLQISGAIGPGSSGAPVLDINGRVVAVTSAMMSSTGTPGSIRYYGQMNEQLKEYLDRLRKRLDETKPGQGASGAFKGAMTDEQYLAALDAMQRAMEAAPSAATSVTETGKKRIERSAGVAFTDKTGAVTSAGPVGGSGGLAFSPGALLAMAGGGGPFELAPPVMTSSSSSFAIPINRIRRVLDDLKAGRQVKQAWLGAIVKTTENRLSFDPIEGGPSADAGMKAGDVLVAADGRKFDSPGSFVDFVTSHKPGDVIELSVKRENKTILLRVTLGDRPQGQEDASAPSLSLPGLFGEPMVTLSLHEESIAVVAKVLSDQTKRSMVVVDPEKITKKVTLELKNMPLENAIKVICKSLGCVYTRDGQAYVISAK